MPPKRKRPLSPIPPSPCPTLHISSPITDRSSRFLAIYSPSRSAKDLSALTQLAAATHRITAFRLPSSQRSLSSQPLYDTGHDDDGERYGGKALQSVLTELGVKGAVVVGRWYGGVMLGPVRFEHIKTCAREAISRSIQEREERAKRVKVGEEGARTGELVRILPERDQSITVLRNLLAEKQLARSSPRAEMKSPAKVPDYTNLPLSALESLERARDATIGWILKEIEKAEAAQGLAASAVRTVDGEAAEASGCPEDSELVLGNGAADVTAVTRAKAPQGAVETVQREEVEVDDGVESPGTAPAT